MSKKKISNVKGFQRRHRSCESMDCNSNNRAQYVSLQIRKGRQQSTTSTNRNRGIKQIVGGEISDRFSRLRVVTEPDSPNNSNSSPHLLSPLFCPAAPSARPNFMFTSPCRLSTMTCSCDQSDNENESNEYCHRCGNIREYYNSASKATEEELMYICISPVWGMKY